MVRNAGGRTRHGKDRVISAVKRRTEVCFRPPQSLPIDAVNIRIARDGVEIGECDRADLEQLAREGQVLRTDHYWHEGMEDWQLLSDLLDPGAWTSAMQRAWFSVARDGVEIRECRGDEIDQLVQTGEVLRTDHYWREGMKEWGLVGDLIDSEPWEPRPVVSLSNPVASDAVEPVAPPPTFRRPTALTIAIACGVAAAVVIALYLIVAFSDRRPEVPTPTAPRKSDAERTDTDLRIKATDQLVAKVKELPAHRLSSFIYFLLWGLG